MRIALICFHSSPVGRLGEKNTGGMNVYVRQLARELAAQGNDVDIFTRTHHGDEPQIIPIYPAGVSPVDTLPADTSDGDGIEDAANRAVKQKADGIDGADTPSQHCTARVIHLDAGPANADKEDLLQYTDEFIDAVLAFQRHEGVEYALVHSHYWLSGVVGIELGRVWDAPHFATFHTLARTKQRARAGERETLERANAEQRIIDSAKALVVSTYIERDDISRLYQVNGTPIVVIPPGVDTALFSPADKRASRDLLGLTDTRTILYVGRIEPLKGLDILIRAASLIHNRGIVDSEHVSADGGISDAAQSRIGSDLADNGNSGNSGKSEDTTRLLIVGGTLEGDAEVERMRTLAVELGIGDMVTFTGSVEQGLLPVYYNAADVFVLPSWYESFGLVAVEAMACGTPVVVSRVGGLTTFVEHGKTGYLVPWRCPDAFARSLETLLENPSLRQAMGKTARRKANRMSWATMANDMIACYHNVVNDMDGQDLQDLRPTPAC